MIHHRPLPAHLRLALTLTAVLPAAAAATGFHPWTRNEPVRFEVAGGTLEASLEPDRGSALALVAVGPHRWTFEGATQALIGQSYSIALHNRTAERLAVVIGVDGLNAFGRQPVAGRFEADVAFVLPPWSERTLPGWQVDDDHAQRFVFSPREWSEGEGRTDAEIGTVVIQVYREQRPPPRRQPSWEDRREGEAEKRRQSTGAAPEAASPPIGTTTGDDVDHPVRTVHFVAATTRPEAWALIDYGRETPGWTPLGRLPLGLGLVATPRGSRIVAVSPGSPADRAGLEEADVIVRIDAVDEPDPGTVRRLLRQKDRGDYVFLRVRRGAHELALKVRT